MRKQDKWYWLVQIKYGPIGRSTLLLQEEVKDIEEIITLFRRCISAKKRYQALGTVSLWVFHRYGHAVTESASYRMDFGRGKNELWGNGRSLSVIEQAWRRAGGVYRRFP